MFMQAKRSQGQGVWAIEELLRTVPMSTVVPAHGELHHMMQLRNRNLLGN